MTKITYCLPFSEFNVTRGEFLEHYYRLFWLLAFPFVVKYASSDKIRVLD
jgi:hypothetical protein